MIRWRALRDTRKGSQTPAFQAIWATLFSPFNVLTETLNSAWLWLRSQLGFGSFRSFAALAVVGVSLSLAIAACSPSETPTSSSSSSPEGSPVAQSQKSIELTLVAYAIPKAAHDAIIPKFVEQWKQSHNGQEVVFKQSYGGSGSQTRAVIDGLEADVVNLALALDTNKLVKAGLINEGWEKRVPSNGIVAKTVAAILVREGNPKNIKTFGDLTRDEVKWVTADPKTSGGARWNVLALWDYALKTGNSEDKAKQFLTKAFTNVPALAKDAREATDSFAKQGQGDALINYENEAILAKEKGEKFDTVIPDINISIDIPVAVVDKNVDKHGTREAAEAFVKFLFTPEAQKEFVKLGYRTVDETLSKDKEISGKFKTIEKLGTVEDYGGWNEIQKKFFEDGALFDQIQADIKR